MRSPDRMSTQAWLTRILAGSLCLCGWAVRAEEPRYAYFEVQYVNQDLDVEGFEDQPEFNQSVAIETNDGNGVRFAAAYGLWRNFYLTGEFVSTDIDVEALVVNDQGEFPASDDFDFTTLRGALGYRYQLTFTTDIVAEVGYDKLDLDFGSFAGENFDADDGGLGASLGIRSVFRDRLELNARARYSDVGEPTVQESSFSDDWLFGFGVGWTLVRGLSITANYETGEIETWGAGIRLDLRAD